MPLSPYQSLPSVWLCRVPGTRQRQPLPSVIFCRVRRSAKQVFAECPKFGTRQRFLHSANHVFPVVMCPTQMGTYIRTLNAMMRILMITKPKITNNFSGEFIGISSIHSYVTTQRPNFTFSSKMYLTYSLRFDNFVTLFRWPLSSHRFASCFQIMIFQMQIVVLQEVRLNI